MHQAEGFYGIIILSMMVAVLIDLVGIDPIKALIWSAVGNGVAAPVILFFIMRMTDDKRIMGHRRNSRLGSIAGWLITGVMAIAGVAAVASFFV